MTTNSTSTIPLWYLKVSAANCMPNHSNAVKVSSVSEGREVLARGMTIERNHRLHKQRLSKLIGNVGYITRPFMSLSHILFYTVKQDDNQPPF